MYPGSADGGACGAQHGWRAGSDRQRLFSGALRTQHALCRQNGVHFVHSADTVHACGCEQSFRLQFCLGEQVVLLGLYNGQRLEHEPEEDMVTYSRALKVRSMCWHLYVPHHPVKACTHALLHASISPSEATPSLLKKH